MSRATLLCGLNLREIYKLWKLRMKSLPFLFVFGGIPLSASEDTAEMVLCVFSAPCKFIDVT